MRDWSRIKAHANNLKGYPIGFSHEILEAIAEIEQLRQENCELANFVMKMNADGAQLEQEKAELVGACKTALQYTDYSNAGTDALEKALAKYG